MFGHHLFCLAVLFVFLASCSSNGTKQNTPVTLQPYESSPTHAGSPPPSSYVLGVGDTVEVNVWRQDTLEKSAKIDPDGNIALPLVGEIKVDGLTVRQAREEITYKLRKYFVDPQVDLNVSEIKSKRAYLFGEVDNPGVYYLDHPTSLWEIIAQGALKKEANQEKVLLLRNAVPEGEKTQIKASLVDLDATKIKSGSFPVDVYAQNGDILYVLPKKIVNMDRFMSHLLGIIGPVLAIETAVVLIPEFVNVLKGEGFSTSTGIIVGQ